MTAVNIVFMKEAVIVATDSQGTEEAKTYDVNKLFSFPNKNMIVACRGQAKFAETFVNQLEYNMDVNSYDDIIEDAENYIQQLYASKNAEHMKQPDATPIEITIYIVGWSKKLNKCLAVSFDNEDNFAKELLPKWAVAPGVTTFDASWRLGKYEQVSVRDSKKGLCRCVRLMWTTLALEV